MIDCLMPYPTYRDSSVPWLGDVPEHWQVRRLKRVCRFAYGDSLPDDTRRHGTVAVFGSNGCVGTHVVANTHAPCIVIGRKGSFGKVNFSAQPVFAIDTTFFVDDRLTKAKLRWLWYLLDWLGLDAVSRDSAVPGLDREEAYQRVVSYPSDIAEQSAIVRFLDHAARRIRRYIRAKRKLIALLNEQKQAIINQAVTRGLDPDVRLKPSGAEWLGDVPEHWRLSRLKFEASHIIDCLHATPEYMESGAYPAIRTADIEPGKLRHDGVRRVSCEQYELWTARLAPRTSDILYSREGERFGIAALVPEGIRLCISQRMMVFRIRPPQRSDFIMWQLNCRHVYAQAAGDVIGATVPHVNVERIKNYWIVLPPPGEQELIVAKIAEEWRGLETATECAQREILFVREYSIRLIADLVTGKLDVREAAANLPDEAEGRDDLEEPDTLAENGEGAEDAESDAVMEEDGRGA